MIIIAENKKSHYLIKEFLIESNIIIEQQRDQNVQFDLSPITDEDDPNLKTIVDTPVFDQNAPATKEMIDVVVKKHPKFSKLKKLFKSGAIISTLAAALLWNNNIQQASDNIASDNSDLNSSQVEQVLSNQEESESEGLTFSVEYDTEIDKEEIKRAILGHEGFEGLPYPDHHQWSIGHGTKAFSNADLSEGEHAKFKAGYKKAKNEGRLAKWIDETIPGWRKKFIETYSIQDDGLPKTSPISEKQAGVAADQSIDHAITSMQKVKYFEVLPINIKKAFIDMAYNMGPGFLKKFKNFNRAIEHAAIVLNSKDLNEAEVEVAINLFEIAAKEILYNFNPDGSIRGKTKYHSDLEKSGRPQKNYELIKRGIEEIRISITPKNFQNESNNESLKKVYKHLFV